MNTFQRVIWAVDPLEDNHKVTRRSKEILNNLVSHFNSKIEPVYVLSDALRGLSLPEGELRKTYEYPAQRALNYYIEKMNIRNLENPTVLVQTAHNAGDAVRAIDTHAQKAQADLIVVNSHGRSGLDRMLLGSFAETLTLHAKTPVLVAGPKLKTPINFDHILFPSDFTPASKKAFDRVQVLAKNLGARITLYHAVSENPVPYMESEFGKHEKQTAKEWAAEARRNGLRVNVELDFRRSKKISGAIVDFAERHHAGMIAMASESSAFSAALLGSIGRQVARESASPVWFLRAA